MFCKHCGKQIREDSTFCPYCGTAVGSGAAAEAGGTGTGATPGTVPAAGAGPVAAPESAAASTAGAAPTPDPASMSPDVTIARPLVMEDADEAAAREAAERAAAAQAATQAQPANQPGDPAAAAPGTASARTRSRRMPIIIAVAAVVLLAVIGVGGWYWYTQQQAAQAEAAQKKELDATHEIAITIKADGLDTSTGSKVPFKVSGTSTGGKKIDDVYFAALGNKSGIKLPRGSYEFSVAASPIAADGTIYSYDPAQTSFTGTVTDKGLKKEASVTLTPIAALDVTDDQIKAAYEMAVKGGVPDVSDATKLKDAATKRHTDAVAKKKADEEAAAKAKAEAEAKKKQEAANARTVTGPGFTFQIPSYWVGRVIVKQSGDTVTIYSKKYPTRDLVSITAQDGPTNAMGDVATSSMGDVSLGGNRYAAVWAHRWGYIISDAYWRNSTDPDDYYTAEEAQELVDLQTGGKVTYEQVRKRGNKETGPGAVPEVDDFIKANLNSTIKPN